MTQYIVASFTQLSVNDQFTEAYQFTKIHFQPFSNAIAGRIDFIHAILEAINYLVF